MFCRSWVVVYIVSQCAQFYCMFMRHWMFLKMFIPLEVFDQRFLSINARWSALVTWAVLRLEIECWIPVHGMSYQSTSNSADSHGWVTCDVWQIFVYAVLFHAVLSVWKKPYRSRQMTRQRGVKYSKHGKSRCITSPWLDSKRSNSQLAGDTEGRQQNHEQRQSCFHFLSKQNDWKNVNFSWACVFLVGYHGIHFASRSYKSILYPPCAFLLSFATCDT